MLFNAHPKAAEVQTIDGWLPLHYAINYDVGSEVFYMIFNAYPKAAEVQDIEGSLPLHIALSYYASSHV